MKKLIAAMLSLCIAGSSIQPAYKLFSPDILSADALYDTAKNGTLTVTAEKTTLTAGEEMLLTASGDDALSHTWSSSDPKVASVDSRGLVTAWGEGKAVISVESSRGGSGSITLTVKKRTLPKDAPAA